MRGHSGGEGHGCDDGRDHHGAGDSRPQHRAGAAGRWLQRTGAEGRGHPCAGGRWSGIVWVGGSSAGTRIMQH
eukprot:8305186-Heterocapsa_arctica.AAC.1